METKYQKGVWATLSTLDIKYFKKQSIVYLIVSALTLVFALIYEKFSHNVYSPFMLGAFIIPLILGAVISFITYKMKCTTRRRLQNNLYNAGVATLTVGSIFVGVLEIFGTTNAKVIVYFFVGVLFILLSLIKK